MFIQKELVALASQKRGGGCGHSGSGRKSIRISIFQGPDRKRVAALRAFRSCCRDSAEARTRWWEETFKVLDTLYGPAPSKLQVQDRGRVELRIRRLIPCPPGLRPTKKPLKAAEKLAQESEIALDAALATRLNQVAPCWAAIDCLPGSNLPRIKEAFQAKLNLLNRNGASVDEFRQADFAMKECIDRLRTGQW